METGLKGKSVVVTGGGSNIGKGIVLAFAREGARITIADFDEPQSQKVAALAKELGAEAALVVKTDVRRMDEVQRMVGAVLNEFGRIDVLVNDAGVWNTTLFTEEPEEEIDWQIETNVKATIKCSKAVLPHMVEAGGGRIINIGSEAGRAGDPLRATYSATKGAVISLTRALARDVGKHNITVNCVCPFATGPENPAEDIGERSLHHPSNHRPSPLDAVSTEEARKAIENQPVSRIGRPADIAAAVVFFASEPASYITGQTLSVNGGATVY